MYLFNTQSKKKEKLVPRDKTIRIYSCGPTVYNFAHIGNFRSYVAADLLQRFLRFQNFAVQWVMNITDIDDKTIAKSIDKYPEEDPHKRLKKVTKYYEDAFFSDLEKLSVAKESFYKNPRATEYIQAMQDLIKKIYEKGFAYEKDGSVYFDVKNFSKKNKYGILKNIDMDNFRATRIEEDDGKQTLADFVLWKKTKKDEPCWDFALDGNNLPGRPGWHIECSAMSQAIFHGEFDIHTGGIDLVFPHHENEIAQSRAAYDHGIAKFWFHNQYLSVNSEKMAKSKNNFLVLKDLEKKGYKPQVVRFFLLSVHYRSPMDFNEKNLRNAQRGLERINNFYQEILSIDEEGEEKSFSEVENICQKALRGFSSSLEDDLNISRALSFLFSLISEINTLLSQGKISGKKTKAVITKTISDIDQVLGVIADEDKNEEIPAEVISLAKKRDEFRKEKDFANADKMRDQILEKGFLIKDKDGGFEILPHRGR